MELLPRYGFELEGRVEFFFVLENFRVVLPLGNPPLADAGGSFQEIKNPLSKPS
jgi:hypothetical protein